MADYKKSRADFIREKYRELDNEVNSLANNALNQVNDNSLALEGVVDDNTLLSEQIKERVKTEKTEEESWWQKAVDTLADLGNKIAEGMFNFFDAIGDFGINTLEHFGALDEETAKNARESDWVEKATWGATRLNPINTLNGDFFSKDYWDASKISEELYNDRQNSFLSNASQGTQDFIYGMASSLGFMLPSIGLSLIPGVGQGVSLATMGVGAGAGSFNENYAETGDYGKSLVYGILSGGTEAATELFVGKALAKVGLGTGKLFGVAGGKTGSSFIKDLGKTMFEEGTEEVVSAVLDPIWQGISNWNGEPLKQYFDKDFWLGKPDSVAGSFTSGALLGGLLGGVSIHHSHKLFGKYGEVASLLEENRELAGKRETQARDEKMAANLKDIAELYGDAMQNATTKQKENLAKLLGNPRELIEEYNNDTKKFVDDKLSQIDTVEKFKTVNLFNELNERVGNKFKFRFENKQMNEHLEDSVNGYFDSKNNTIVLNEAKVGKYASVLTHEFLGHAVGGFFSETQRQSLFDKIVETNWFKNNQIELNKNYGKERKAKWQEEVIANYVEDIVNKGGNTAKFVADITLKNTLFERFKSAFKKFNSYGLLKNKTILQEFLKDINNALDYFDPKYRAVFEKMMANEKLTEKEQKIADKLKDFIPKEALAYSKDLKSQSQSVKDNVEDLDPYETNKAKDIKLTAENLIGRVNNVKTFNELYNLLEKIMQKKFGENFTIKGKKLKARRLFEEYNLTPELFREQKIEKFVNDLLTQQLTKEGITYTDVLQDQGIDIKEYVKETTELLYSILTKTGKLSEVSKKVIRLFKQLDKLDYKVQLVQLSSQTRAKMASMQKALLKKFNGKENNFVRFFNKFMFTKRGYLSMTNFKNLKEMIDSGAFSNFMDAVADPNYDLTSDVEIKEQIKLVKQMAEEIVDGFSQSQTSPTLEQVRMFKNWSETVYKLFNDYNEKTIENTRDEAKDLSDQIEETARYIGSLNGFKKAFVSYLLDFASPKTILAYVFGGTENEAFKKVYEKLYLRPYESQRKMEIKFLKMRDEFVNVIEKDRYKKVTINGKKVPKYVLYQYYLNTLSPDNMIRIKNSNLVFTDKTTTEFTMYEMNEAIKQLTEAEKTELNALFDLYNGELQDYVIKIGNIIPREKYYPIVASDIFKNRNFASPEQMRYNINALNNNRLKSLTNKNTKIEINVDPLTLFDNYVESMTITGEIGIQSQKLNRLFHLKLGNKKTLIEMISSYTPNANTYFSSIYNKLIGNTDIYQKDNFGERMIGKFSTATLGLNLGSTLKQLASLSTARVKTGVVNGVKALFSPRTYSLINAHRSYLKENNAVFAARIYNNGFVRSKTMASTVAVSTNRVLNKAVNLSLKLMEMLDRFTCYTTFEMALTNVKNAYPNLSESEQLAKANEMWTDIILETQSNADRISVNMIRSGEKKPLKRFLFGLFASDSQNKANILLENIINNSIIKKKLRNPNITSEERVKLEKQLKEVHSKNGAFVSSLITSGLVVVLANALMKWIYDREEPEDTFSPENFMSLAFELLGETFVDWIPVVGQIKNFIQYGEVSFAPTENINDVFKALSELSKGNLNAKNFTELTNKLLMLMGIPAGNIDKLIKGILGNFAPEAAMKYKSVLYGTKSEYLNAEIGKNIKDKQYHKATNNLSLLYTLNKFPVSDEVAKEMVLIKANGGELSSNNIPKDLKPEEQKVFVEVYSKADQLLKELIKDENYKKLSFEKKAVAISKATKLYYNYAMALAKKETMKVDLEKWIKKSNFTSILSAYAQIKGETKDKKDVIAKINQFKGLSRNEKLMVGELLGYKISSQNKANKSNYLESIKRK